MTATSSAQAGLALVAAAGLSAEAPVVVLANALTAGEATDEELVDAWDQWNSIVATRPNIAGIAYLCMGGTDGLARARVAARRLTLQGRIDQMMEALASLNQVTRAKVETALQVAADRGIDRAGRVATRNVRNPALKAQLEERTPAEALAYVATVPTIYAAIERAVSDVIASTVDDAVAATAPILSEAQAAVSTIIGDALFTIPEPGDRFDLARAEALTCMSTQLSLWLASRAEPAAVEPSRIGEGRVPPGISVETVDVAGGGMSSGGRLSRGDGGAVRGIEGTAAFEGVAAGPIAIDLVHESLAAWAPDVADGGDVGEGA